MQLGNETKKITFLKRFIMPLDFVAKILSLVISILHMVNTLPPSDAVWKQKKNRPRF